MSILQSARQQHEKPSSAFEASLGRGVERERRWLGPVLAWVLGMPLCLALGAGSNYAWHWRNNKPIEQKVEVRTETPLPYRIAETQQEFSTQPFPAAPEAPVTSTASTPKVTTVMPPAPEDADPLAGIAHRNLKREFAKARRIREVGMSRALTIAGLALEGSHHRALDDALNIARLVPVLPYGGDMK